MNESLLSNQLPGLQTQNPQSVDSPNLQQAQPLQATEQQSDVLGLQDFAQSSGGQIIEPNEITSTESVEQPGGPVQNGINIPTAVTAVVICLLVAAAAIFVWSQRHEGDSFQK